MQMISPDAMGAAAAHVEREYGYGYVLGIESSGASVAIFLVRHFDGSEFRLLADKWGNVDRLPDEWPTMDAAAQFETFTRISADRQARLDAIHADRRS